MEPSTLVNLTDHDVKVLNKQDESIVIIPPSGIHARVEINRHLVRTITLEGCTDSIPVYTNILGKVQNLPKPQKGHLFIVSRICALAASDRTDLLIPNQIVEGNNVPEGCYSFSTT